MPGLNPREMNGQDYGRFGHDQGFTNGHFDPYGRDDRDDMRGDEDPYRRPVRNGGVRPAHDRFNDHLADQSSLSDFNSSEPAFELDHLATFAAGGLKKGTMHVEDGLRKLRQMENTTGIWTMRCILLVERRFIVILDKNSGEELERFPVHFIHEPTAIFKNDRREIYNNLILFTVMDENNKKDPQADMHIFQSVRTPAQNIVDEIFASKRGQSRVSSAGEADLYEIFKQNAIETQIEVESELLALSSLPASKFVVSGTNDQFVWKWDAASKQSEIDSSSEQQSQDTTTNQTSQNVSAKQHSKITSSVTQQSSSRVLSSGGQKSETVSESTGQSDLTQTAHSHSDQQSHLKDRTRAAFTASQQTAALSHIKAQAEKMGARVVNKEETAHKHSGHNEEANMFHRTDKRDTSGRLDHWSEQQQRKMATANQSMDMTADEQRDMYHRSDRHIVNSRAAHTPGNQPATANQNGVLTANEQADLYSRANKQANSSTARVSEHQQTNQRTADTTNQRIGMTANEQEDRYQRSDRYNANSRADESLEPLLRATYIASKNGALTTSEETDLYSRVNKHTNKSSTARVSEHLQTAASRGGGREAFSAMTASEQAGRYNRVDKHASEQADLYSRIDSHANEQADRRVGRHANEQADRHVNSRSRHASWHQQRSSATANQNASNEHVARMRATEQADHTERNETSQSNQGYKIPPPPSGPAPEPPGSKDPYDLGGFRETIEHRQYNQFNVSQYGSSQFHNGGGFIGGGQRSSMMARPSYLPYREREDEIGSNELLERDVQLLNHCFDDIEKFVARLQQAAEAYKELERRKKERSGKGKKGPIGGAGMLAHRARPPPAQDFVDIFQKFKLSFNLLAKLKAHIHDPNAPELVHFLFTPLSLIYEASRDPIHGSMNLGEQAMAPVLTQDAKQLLLNCLTSKEIELWQALGKNWTTSKEEWKGYIPPYVPRFYDGWEPAPTLVDEPSSRTIDERHSTFEDRRSRRPIEHEKPSYVPVKPMPFPDEDPYQREHLREHREREYDLEPNPTRNMVNSSSVSYHHQYTTEQAADHRRRAPEPVVQREPPPPVSQPVPTRENDNLSYMEELKRTGSLAFEVLHDRQGKNTKELTVYKGDFLQVLDNSRNWWKVRNFKGESGYCPYTILKQVNGDNSRDASNASVDQALTGAKKPSASSRGDSKYF